MADKKQTKVYLIPEDETRDSHTYHYTATVSYTHLRAHET